MKMVDLINIILFRLSEKKLEDTDRIQRAIPIQKYRLGSVEIPIIKIRRSDDRLVFIMGIYTWKYDIFIWDGTWFQNLT